jgi:hypothetical protein
MTRARHPAPLALLALLALAGAARAEEGPVDRIKEGVKEAAHAVAEGARTVGHETKKLAKKGWDDSREGRENVKQATKEGAGAVKEGAQATGHAVKEGAGSVWQATKRAVGKDEKEK